MATREWFVISDLHLGDRSGGRDVDAALCGFLEAVVGASNAERRTLVLLGDTFDLQGPVRQSVPAVIERLGGLAARHRPVVRALAACRRSGVALHVVSGNHDVELARPAVAAALTCLLGATPDDPDVRFSPWLVHVPGVLHAEHGNQHHALNRMPTVLSITAGGAAYGGEDGARELPVPPLGAASTARFWCPADDAAAARVARVARSVRSTVDHERLTRTAWYAALLAREAAELGLPDQAVSELAAVSRFRLGQAAVGAGWRAGRRWVGRERPGSHLVSRAAVVHRVLTRHGAPVPAYVFGHDHRAVRLGLPGPPPAAYLNSGTWSDDIRSVGPDSVDRQLFPYVRITASDEAVAADLHFWRSTRGAAMT